MVGMDDVLQSAFANVNQPQQDFQAGLGTGAQIADNITKLQAQLYMHQQSIMQQQAELRQKYTEKAGDLVKSAGDDKLPNAVRMNLINAASEMSFRGGMPRFSDDFKEAFSTDPELRQSFSDATNALLQSAQSPKDPEKQQKLIQAVQAAATMSHADYPSVMRQLQDSNKDMLELYSKGYQQKLSPEENLTLSRAKTMMEEGQKIASQLPGIESNPYAYQKPLIDPNTGRVMVDPTTGKPVGNLLQALNRVAQIDPNKELNPQSQQVYDAALAQGRTVIAQEKQYQDKKDLILKAQQQIQGTPNAALSPQARMLLNAGPPNPQNIDKLYPIAAQAVQAGVTKEDQVKRERDLNDRSDAIRTNVDNLMTSVNKAESVTKASLSDLRALVMKPGVTIDELNGRLKTFQNEMSNAVASAPQGQEDIIKKPLIDKVIGVMGSLAGANPQFQVDPTSKQQLLEAIDSASRKANVGPTSVLYSQYQQLRGMGGEVYPRTKDVLRNIETQIGSRTKNPAPGDLNLMYQAALKELSPPDRTPSKIASDMADHLLQNGYNPLAAERFVKAKQKTKLRNTQ